LPYFAEATNSGNNPGTGLRDPRAPVRKLKPAPVSARSPLPELLLRNLDEPDLQPFELL